MGNDQSSKTQAFNFSWPLPIAVIVAIVSFMGFNTPFKPAPNADVNKSSAAESGRGTGGPVTQSPTIEVLNDVFGRPATAEQTQSKGVEKANAIQSYSGSLRMFECQQRKRLKCIIGTIPDPNDSHSQLSFDLGIEAIVRAFQSHGYVRNQYRLLWQSDLSLLRRDPNSAIKLAAHSWASPIVFRKEDEVVIMLLVGETASTGVHRESLHDALNFAEAVRSVQEPSAGEGNSSEKYDYFVLGPWYSGSSAGLRDAIDDWAESAGVASPKRVRMVTGIATSPSNQKVFECDSGNRHAPKIRFSRAVATDDIVLDAILDHFIVDRGIPAKQIAILTEVDTPYGADLQKLSQAKVSKDSGQSSEKGTKQSEPTPCDGGEEVLARPEVNNERDGIKTLTYPMMLSRMRSEYSRRGLSGKADQSQVEQLNRRNLDLSQDISPYANEILPTFSSSTVVVADRILESLISTIREEKIKVVGLMGTEITDKLFLAQRIRELVPNVQFFTLEADLLFTHSNYSRFLRGMVVGSSYSLYPPTQRWSLNTSYGRRVANRPYQFASDTSQGVYNATLTLLNHLCDRGQRIPLLDHGSLFGNRGIETGYLSPSDEKAKCSSPRGWLSIVGETKLWPLMQIGPAESNDSMEGSRTESDENGSQQKLKWRNTLLDGQNVGAPRISAAVLICLLVIGLVVCLAYWNSGSSRSSEAKGGGNAFLRALLGEMRWLQLPSIAEVRDRKSIAVAQRHAFDRSIFIGILFFNLMIILLCIGAPIFAYFWEFAFNSIGPSFVWDVLLVGLVCAAWLAAAGAALFGAIAAFRYDYWSTWGPNAQGGILLEPRRPMLDRIVRALLLVLIACGVAGMISVAITRAKESFGNRFDYDAADTTEVALFIIRCGNYTDLVNPLMPLAFLAAVFAIWAFCNLKRSLLASNYDFENPLSVRNLPTELETEDGYIPAQLDRVEKGYSRLEQTTAGFLFLGMRVGDWVVCTALFLFLGHLVWFDWIPTSEVRFYGFDWVFRASYLIAVLVVVGLLLRARDLFRSTEGLLRSVNHLPLAESFATLPADVKSKVSDFLHSTYPRVDDYHLMVRQIRRLSESRTRVKVHADKGDDRFERDAADLVKQAKADSLGLNQHRDPAQDIHLGAAIASFSSRHLLPKLIGFWDDPGKRFTPEQDPGRDEEKRKEQGKEQEQEQKQEQKQGKEQESPHLNAWLQDAEALIAIQIAHQIRVVFLYARTLLGGGIAMFFCLLWAINCYPFQPGQLLNFACLVLIAWMVIINTNAILRFNRNPILSRISGTEPNKLTLNKAFWQPMISYVGLPILGVIATLVPTVGQSLMSVFSVLSQYLGKGG